MNSTVVLASKNQGKLAELRAILAHALPDFDTTTNVVDTGTANAPDVIEDGTSFAENALKKAREIARATGMIAVADDSGLAVDIMGGAPGIFSARWAGTHGDDQANLELLLAQLADIPAQHRDAQFVCAAALATPDGTEHVELGTMKGIIATEARGTNGFGYDPIFIPEGMTVTAAQLAPEQKNAISHRAKAFQQLTPHLVAVLRA